MILEVYSVFDRAVNAYTNPFLVRSKGEALRAFTELANRGGQENNVRQYPSDFTLCFCGRFDDASGTFITAPPERIVSANEVLVDEVFPPEKQIDRGGIARS